MRIVCWQTILMKHHTLFFSKIGKMSVNLSSAAVVIGALRVDIDMSSAEREKCQRRTYNKIIDTSIESCHI